MDRYLTRIYVFLTALLSNQDDGYIYKVSSENEQRRKHVTAHTFSFNRMLPLCIKGGGRVVRWCWVPFQCRGVLQFG